MGESIIDISEELYTIDNSSKGKEVKDAIYRAIDKLNRYEISPSPIPPSPVDDDDVTPEVDVVLASSVGFQETPENSEFVGPDGMNGLFMTGNSTSGTRTVTVSPVNDCLTVVVLLSDSRSGNTAYPDGEGWTKIYESENTTKLNTSSKIYSYCVWTKPMAAGSNTVVIKKACTRYYICCLYCATSISVIDDVIFTSVSYTASPITNKPRLYFASLKEIHDENYTTSSGAEMYELTANSVGSNGHLWYDYHPENGTTIDLVFDNSSKFKEDGYQVLSMDINY